MNLCFHEANLVELTIIEITNIPAAYSDKFLLILLKVPSTLCLHNCHWVLGRKPGATAFIPLRVLSENGPAWFLLLSSQENKYGNSIFRCKNVSLNVSLKCCYVMKVDLILNGVFIYQMQMKAQYCVQYLSKTFFLCREKYVLEDCVYRGFDFSYLFIIQELLIRLKKRGRLHVNGPIYE